MTDVAREPVAPPARERGWARPAIGLVLLLFVPLTPMLRMLLPVDQMVVLLVPAVAVCALVGWMRGGRPLVAVLWTVLAVWVLWTFAASTGTFGALVGGWSLLLAAAFGATTAWNDAGQARPFLQRALAAIALALTVGATVAAIAPGGVTALQRTVATEIGVRHDTTIARWHAAKALPEWQELITKNPDATPLFEQLEAQMEAIPPMALIIYPALLALESSAMLGFAPNSSSFSIDLARPWAAAMCNSDMPLRSQRFGSPSKCRRKVPTVERCSAWSAQSRRSTNA